MHNEYFYFKDVLLFTFRMQYRKNLWVQQDILFSCVKIYLVENKKVYCETKPDLPVNMFSTCLTNPLSKSYR